MTEARVVAERLRHAWGSTRMPAGRWMPAETGVDGRLEPVGFSTHEITEGLRACGAERRQLVTRYTWSTPSPADVIWMWQQLGDRAVVEIGAGTGYWAWQLEQAGVNVAAYDPNPPAPDNMFCNGGPYTTVLPGDASAAAEHPDRALLMVWPPSHNECASEALSAYRGDLVLYAGEGRDGCTGDDAFHERLAADWGEVSVAPHHVTWSGIHCRLAAYRRRSQGGA